MTAFEVKTYKNDYPFLIIANGFKEAINVLHTKGIYDIDIIHIWKLEQYISDNILIDEALISEKIVIL